LILERGISFEIFADLILEKKYLTILENPNYNNQMIFIICYNNYTYVVPFIIENDNTIFLKTIFPSRKFHKIYGGTIDENYTRFI
jgi:hypothetical protein